MQIGELALELDQGMAGAGNVACAARASAHAPGSVDHFVNDRRMLRHREIVVRAPHDDLAGTGRRMPDCVGKPPSDTLEIRKNSIPPLPMQLIQSGGKEVFVLHSCLQS